MREAGALSDEDASVFELGILKMMHLKQTSKNRQDFETSKAAQIQVRLPYSPLDLPARPSLRGSKLPTHCSIRALLSPFRPSSK